MTTSMKIPIIWSQQVTSLSGQQTSGMGIDISGLLSTLIPLMVIMAMMRGMVVMVSTPNHVKTPTIKSNPPQLEQPTINAG